MITSRRIAIAACLLAFAGPSLAAPTPVGLTRTVFNMYSPANVQLCARDADFLLSTGYTSDSQRYVRSVAQDGSEGVMQVPIGLYGRSFLDCNSGAYAATVHGSGDGIHGYLSQSSQQVSLGGDVDGRTARTGIAADGHVAFLRVPNSNLTTKYAWFYDAAGTLLNTLDVNDTPGLPGWLNGAVAAHDGLYTFAHSGGFASGTGDVWFLRYSLSGAQVMGKTIINPTLRNNEGTVFASGAPDGRFAIAWYGYGGPALRMFNADGTPLTAEIDLDPGDYGSINDLGNLSLSMNALGNVVVVYQRRNGGVSRIMAARFAADGSRLDGGPFEVADDIPANVELERPSVALLDNNAFAVGFHRQDGSATLLRQFVADAICSGTSPGTIRLALTASHIDEDGGTLDIAVRRISGRSGEAQVTYTTTDGSATQGADYARSVGTLQWARGDQADKFIRVPIVNDTTPEPTQRFQVSLSNARCAALGATSVHTVTILDEDTQVQLAGPAIVHAAEGSIATFTVRRVGSSLRALSVAYSVPENLYSATPDIDYVAPAAGAMLSWAAGDSSRTQQISIALPDNGEYRDFKSFYLRLGAVTGGVLSGAGAVQVYIDDNDSGVEIEGAPLVREGDPIVATVRRVGNPRGVVSVRYDTRDEDRFGHGYPLATGGTDYPVTSGVLSFADGETVKTITVPTTADTVSEGTAMPGVPPFEMFGIELSAPSGANLVFPSTSFGQNFIVDDDASAGVTAYFERFQHDPQGDLCMPNYRIGEGASVTCRIIRVGDASQSISVDWATVPPGAKGGLPATAGVDYVAGSGTLSWAAGDSSDRFITVQTLNDSVHEDPEAFRIHLANAVRTVVLYQPGLFFIIDDDP